MDITLNEILNNREVLDKFNSLTKYPSILTYHALGERGGMTESLCNDEAFPADTMLEATEKVDGTNTRILIIGDDYVIGSRTELIYAKGDRIINNVQINPTIKELANFLNRKDLTKIVGYNSNAPVMLAVYGEIYGYNIQEGSKVYIADSKECKEVKFRIFDIYALPLVDLKACLDKEQNFISHWREDGGQPWYTTTQIQEFCEAYNIDRTPVVKAFNSNEMPTEVNETYAFLKTFADSRVMLTESNESANQKFGRSEGIVVRTPDRSFIRKLRFEDYRKGEMNNWQVKFQKKK